MSYCFMNIDKIKSFSNMNARYRHNYRTVEVKNADRSLLNQNHEVVRLPFDSHGRQMNYKQAWEQRMDHLEYYKTHKIRSNGVLGYEIVTTFTRDRINHVNVQDWQRANEKWMRKTFDVAGDGRSNVLSIVYHGDEAGNVHCHALIVPIDERGRLNAKRFTGEPQKMRALQNSYAKDMERFGLERGIPNSRASHTDIKRFYSALNQKIEAPALKKGESFSDYIERTKDYFKTQMAAAYKQELDTRRKGHEELAKQRNLEQEAIKKELAASRQLAYENFVSLHQSAEQFERKKETLAKEIETMMEQKVEIQENIHDIQFELQGLQEALQKAKEYDRITEQIMELQETDPEQAIMIIDQLFTQEETLDPDQALAEREIESEDISLES